MSDWNHWTWTLPYHSEYVVFEDAIFFCVHIEYPGDWKLLLRNSSPKSGATKRKPGRIPENNITISYARRNQIRLASQEELVMAKLKGRLDEPMVFNA